MNFDLNVVSTYMVMVGIDSHRPHVMTYLEFGCGCKVGVKTDGSVQLYSATAFCEYHRNEKVVN